MHLDKLLGPRQRHCHRCPEVRQEVARKVGPNKNGGTNIDGIRGNNAAGAEQESLGCNL